jgi:hypothetical protein
LYPAVAVAGAADVADAEDGERPLAEWSP